MRQDKAVRMREEMLIRPARLIRHALSKKQTTYFHLSGASLPQRKGVTWLEGPKHRLPAGIYTCLPWSHRDHP